MVKQKIKANFKMEKEKANRINNLLQIEDFKKEKSSLRNLGFYEEQNVYHAFMEKEGYTVYLDVYTGQKNAWIEVEIITPKSIVLTKRFEKGHIEGEYIIEKNDITIIVFVGTF